MTWPGVALDAFRRDETAVLIDRSALAFNSARVAGRIFGSHIPDRLREGSWVLLGWNQASSSELTF